MRVGLIKANGLRLKRVVYCYKLVISPGYGQQAVDFPEKLTKIIRRQFINPVLW